MKEGGLAGVYAYRHDGSAVDLRHECTHALLHARLPMVPLWLDEGLAKYFEVPAEQRAFDHPYFGWLRWDMRLGMIRTVSDLEQRQRARRIWERANIAIRGLGYISCSTGPRQRTSALRPVPGRHSPRRNCRQPVGTT